MIEPHKHHYADLDKRKADYKQLLGEPPVDSNIYEYYINMMDLAIQSRSKDTDANRLKFPHSIGTKQELIKVIMIIQQDAIRSVIAPPPPKKKLFGKWRKK